MTEKIEWYREVLELEPNSKVFLPLAKLLVEENENSHAIDILQRGLDRHPDFLEARLFLIELLYKTGKKDECDAEVKKLGKMFATYAGFWQAWAACLSGDNEQDTASVLRFLAATFLHGPLSLHEVLNRGLASYIPEARMAAPKVETQNPVETPAEEQAAEAENEALAGETAWQMDIEHANNQALEEIVQPAPEEAPVEAAKAEEAGESPVAEIAPAEHPAEEMAAEPEATDSPAGNEVLAAPEDQTAAEEQAAIAELSREAQAEPEEPAQETQEATEEHAAAEKPADEEALIAEPASEEPAVEESSAAMVEESAAQVMEAEPAAQEEDMISNAAEVEASASLAIAEDREPVAQEIPEAALAPEQAPVAPEESEAAETEMPAEAQPEMPEEALAASQEEALPAPGAEELPATEQVPAESLVSAPPTLEEIREAANDGQCAEAVDDVAGTGGESLQTIFEQNIAPGNPETPQATGNLPSEASAADLPVVETAQPALAEQGDDLPSEEYAPKFKDSGEQYTVRTRSMAEVLAEQDDLEGALAIYRELLAAAPEGAEKNDLQLRISTLAQKLQEAQEAASAPVEYEPGSVSSKSREKLISMLEALARRVEARAQS